MKAIITHVSNEYFYYVHGVVTPAKAVALVMKFIDRYEITKSTQQRWRHKKKGLSNSQLVMWYSSKENRVYWWLLSTAGEGYFHQVEKSVSVKNRSNRLPVPFGYELVKSPRPERKPSWTFQFTKQRLAEWAELIKSNVRRKHTKALGKHLDELHRSVGFHAVRSQVFSLVRLAKKEWKRNHKGDYPFSNFIAWSGRYKAATLKNVTEI